MSSRDDHRRLLGAFLRRHRERLTAADVGLAPARHGRRRTPGLRREEVAQICGMSPTWYAWIEQGRDISVSPAALARMADALHLTLAERAYLFELTEKRDPAALTDEQTDAGPIAVLQQALDASSAPAYLLDRLWAIRAWNAPAADLFAEWIDGHEPCLLGFVFLSPAARRLIPDWDHRARRIVAEFRADTGRSRDDPALQALVARLSEASAAFAALWADQAVLAREGGERSFDHPDHGLRHYEQVTLAPAGFPGHKFVMLVDKGVI
ncbi:helix-turn-helix transcriptional regulator [Lichenihabitans psoromatis]|uniref:helix-turn-helix transcriptional regulator n=1 Tax=Lichenihabitans psoromatis TaxID=2528642 RepID=UPI00103834FC|nr:helix-turn-helix transcriptional regulator [Lichenihabitans psoromatis]